MRIRRARLARAMHGRSGLSLIEVVLGVSLTLSMILVVGLTTDRTMGMFRQRRASEDVATQTQRALRKIADTVLFARRDNLVPEPVFPDQASVLTYQVSDGVTNGAVDWGVPITIGFEYETGELDDGLDNNGNGLADEGMVVWTENPGPNERRVVWAHNVREFQEGEDFNGVDDNGNGLEDEMGLSFTIQGDVLTIRLCLEEVGPLGDLVTKTAQTSVRIRN